LQGDGLGSIKQGESIALVTTAAAEDVVIEAIDRAGPLHGLRQRPVEDRFAGFQESGKPDLRILLSGGQNQIQNEMKPPRA